MKYLLNFLLVLMVLTSCSSNNKKEIKIINFTGEKISNPTPENYLPHYPNLEDQYWFKFNDDYVNKTAYLLLNSVFQSNDSTIHYVLNIKSSNNHNNLSYETLDCDKGTYQVFAFGDNHNQKWIKNTGNYLQEIDQSLNSKDLIRKSLKNSLCSRSLPTNIDDLKKKLR